MRKKGLRTLSIALASNKECLKTSSTRRMIVIEIKILTLHHSSPSMTWMILNHCLRVTGRFTWVAIIERRNSSETWVARARVSSLASLGFKELTMVKMGIRLLLVIGWILVIGYPWGRKRTHSRLLATTIDLCSIGLSRCNSSLELSLLEANNHQGVVNIELD